MYILFLSWSVSILIVVLALLAVAGLRWIKDKDNTYLIIIGLAVLPLVITSYGTFCVLTNKF